MRKQAEVTESSSSRDKYDKNDGSTYSSKEGSRNHGSRDRYDSKSDRYDSKSDRYDSRSDKRDRKDNKSDRRRKAYEDKYSSDSDDERVILKKGERKKIEEDENDDLRTVINKQRGIVENEDGKGLVFEYAHQGVEDERPQLKGFFGGAFAHLREDSRDPNQGAKQDGGNYGPKMDQDVKDPEKESGKAMERTLLLELLKRQFPDIRYLTERQGGLELMQKIFGAAGMSGLAGLGGLAGLDLEGGGARSVTSEEGSVKNQQFKQEANVLSLAAGEGNEKKIDAKSASRDSRRDRSRSKSRERLVSFLLLFLLLCHNLVRVLNLTISVMLFVQPVIPSLK